MRKLLLYIATALLLFLPVWAEESTIAPTISGVRSYRTMVGESVDYTSGVRSIAGDGGDVSLVMDDSAVDFSAPGVYTVTYTARDTHGNITIAEAKITVIADENPPVITYTRRFDVYVGDDVPYMDGVSVSDDTDAEPVLTVDASQLNVQVPGKYPVYLTATDASGNCTSVKIKVVVEKPTEKPTFSGVGRREVYIGDAVDCLEGITAQDLRGDPLEIQVDDSKLDMTKTGSYTVRYSCEDRWGNKAKVSATFRVRVDKEAPKIIGAKNITVKPGQTVSYKKDIQCTDNHDPSPKLTVDNSQVNLQEVGRYPVTYTAVDASGNKCVVSITVKVSASMMNEDDLDKLWPHVDKVLGEIITDDMTDMEKAFKIYGWTYHHIRYNNTSDKSHWVMGAYEGLRNRTGDCFTYFSVSKALLTRAGIDNVDVVKSDISKSRHYWSLVDVGGGYYHFDCCRFMQPNTKFFLLTDKELAAWDAKNRNAHPFDNSLYPERATKSVQGLLNYAQYTVKE